MITLDQSKNLAPRRLYPRRVRKDGLGEATFTFDADLRILTWDPAAESLTGVPAGEAVGKRCWEILGGSREEGAMVCHTVCSYALGTRGLPVPLRRLAIRTKKGTRGI